MTNHLDKFYLECPTLKAQYIAFVVWISGPSTLSLQCQLTFNHYRKWLCQRAMQIVDKPKDMISLKFDYDERQQLNEHTLKSFAFPIANVRKPTKGPPTKGIVLTSSLY